MAQDTIRMVVTGQQIIDAVEAIAEEPHIERDFVDGEDVFVVGQESGYPYQHLIVTADGFRNINPATIYNFVTVVEHDWGGVVYAVGYGRQHVTAAVRDFAEKMRRQFSD